ncbi:MAG: SH3 domain-containing protein [Treponema sp.]|nr:SH3 domain-containing protein [Treponema sp.]
MTSSCSRMGWGILLWSTEDPPISSGTVLPVYIRSNIDHVWVVGIPDGKNTKIEVPLSLFEFSGSKRKAIKRAEEFSKYAHIYAENMQDGLPIRDGPDNGSRRVYRLRPGEIIKVLELVEGNPPISTTGDPLPGDWFLVLTNDGVRGFCFSYRLKMFDHYEGPLIASPVSGRDEVYDPDLDMILSRTWSPESYHLMVSSRRINVTELEKNYRFDPGQDSGTARIFTPEVEMNFPYESIVPDGERAWRFEGTNLQMNLRTNTTLAVQYQDNAGARRTLLFSALTADIDDIIMQENSRRETQFMTIYNQGPVFTSNNYGTISLSESGNIVWMNFELLIPHLIPSESSGRGLINMDLFVSGVLAEQYTGAFTLRLTDVTPNKNLYFMYTLDNMGLRLESVPEFGIEDVTVARRSSTPMVLYFFRDQTMLPVPSP